MIIVCYDFHSDRKRTRFSKFLKQFGNRIQYSVYSIKNSRRIINNIISEVEYKYKKQFNNTDHILILD